VTSPPRRGSPNRESPSRAHRGRVESHWEAGVAPLDGDFPEIVCLDLEATGLSASADHVIEIGAVRFRGSEVVGRYHTMVNPGVRLPPMIRRMTGIADRDLAVRLPRQVEMLDGRIVTDTGKPFAGGWSPLAGERRSE